VNQGQLGIPMPQPFAVPYVLIQDQKAQNTDGGTFTSGAFQARTLNTIVSDSAGIASLATNQVTLPPGTYRVRIQCPACGTLRHQARLQNITDATTLLIGSSEFNQKDSASNLIAVTHSVITGRITLTGTKVLEVQHRCQTTQATNGLGIAANFGTEVYTSVEVWKEG
jgi:hypothetical protein